MIPLIIFIAIGVAIFVGMSNYIIRAKIGFAITCFLIALVTVASSLAGCIGVIIGTAVTPKEYKAPIKVEETEIVTLYNELIPEGRGRYYVYIDADNVYTYRYKTESNVLSEEDVYTVATLSASDNCIIEEVEIKDGSNPRIEKYTEIGKVGLFNLSSKRTTYIFYVPEGSISRTITLN